MGNPQSKKEEFKKTLEEQLLESLYPLPSSLVIKVASRRPTKPNVHKLRNIILHTTPIGGTDELVVNGRDGRVEVKKPGEWPNSAHGLLTMNFRGKAYSGTGVMIGANIVLTAGHNLYDYKDKTYADIKNIQFLPGMSGKIAPFDAIEVEKYFVSPKYIREKKEDYGILILKEPVGESTGYFGLACLEAEEIKEKTINVTGYPGDKVKNKPSGTYEMWGMEGKAHSVDQNKGLIHYLIDTTEGQSGSGVWYKEGEDYYICGVHVSGDRSVNTATLLTRAMYKQIYTWLQQVSCKDLLSNSGETKKLRFRNQEINAECVSLLVEYGVNQLTYLDVSRNQIDSKGMKALAKNNSWVNLVKLDLSGEEIHPFPDSLDGSRAGEIAGAVRTVGTILEVTKVATAGNGVSLGMPSAVGFIVVFPAIVAITFSQLSSTQSSSSSSRSVISAEGAKWLAKNESWINLSKLKLCFNNIGADGAKGLSANKSWINLSHLNLCGNNIGEEGAKELAQNKSWTNLSKLQLSSNNIGAKGAKALAKNTSWINLLQLDLNSNKIEVEGAKKLAKNRSWTKLSQLNLSFNKIGPKGAKKLAKNESWTNLSILYLWGNNIGADEAKLLRQNKAWKEQIDIQGI